MGGIMWQIILGVFAVPLLVWILSSLLRAAEEERPRVGPGGRGPNAPRPRRPAADIDSFLEEVSRRREGAERRRAGGAVGSPLPPPVRPRPPVGRQAPPSVVPVLRAPRVPLAPAEPVDVVVVAEG